MQIVQFYIYSLKKIWEDPGPVVEIQDGTFPPKLHILVLIALIFYCTCPKRVNPPTLVCVWADFRHSTKKLA